MAFDWTTKYSSWTPEQQAQATRFLTPNLLSGNFQGIYDKAQELGVTGTGLTGALNATGWTPDALQWRNSAAYEANPDQGVLNAMKNSTPFSVSDVNAFTRENGLPGFSDISSIGRPKVPLDPLAAGSRGLSPDQRFDFSKSIGLVPGTNTINRFMRQGGMIGGARRPQWGGLLSSAPQAYSMTQYAPQYDWQQLGGLLGRSAFRG